MQHPIETIESAQSVRISGKDLSRIGRFLGRRLESHRRLWAAVVLILSEFLLAALVWEVLVVVHGFWRANAGIGEIAFVELLPGLVLWVSLRALLGLFPGYGLDETEELRRQTYTSLIMHRTGLWGKPAIVLASRGARLSLWEMLHEEWQLGFRPVVVSDSHAVPAGEAFEAVHQKGPLADALSGSGSGGRIRWCSPCPTPDGRIWRSSSV